jgi:hypothetical protein
MRSARNRSSHSQSEGFGTTVALACPAQTITDGVGIAILKSSFPIIQITFDRLLRQMPSSRLSACRQINGDNPCCRFAITMQGLRVPANRSMIM